MSVSINDILTAMKGYSNWSGKGRDPRYLDPCQILQPEIIGLPGSFMLVFKGQADTSDAKKDNDPNKFRRYEVNVKFLNQNRSKMQSMELPLEVPVGRDEVFYFSRPTMDSPVSLSCGCLDFIQTWALPLMDHGACALDLNKYRPEDFDVEKNNPKHVMGMCKHLWQFIKDLQGGGYIA